MRHPCRISFGLTTYRMWQYWGTRFSNVYHRVGGPAIEFNDGEKKWYVHGKLIDWQKGNFKSNNLSAVPGYGKECP